MSTVTCSGWWQQSGFGRQSMKNLQLSIEGDQLLGKGEDIIAPFSLQGRFRTDGHVEIIKQYENRHHVIYVGRYDGEGTLSGEWDISGYRGLWSIRFNSSPMDGPNDIREI